MTETPTRGLLESLLELLAELFGVVKSGTANALSAYGQFIKRCTILCWGAAGVLFVFCLLGLVLGSAGLFSISLTLAAFPIAVWLLLLAPVLVLVAVVRETIPPFNRVVTGVLVALVLVVSLGLYLYLFFPYLEPRLTFLLVTFIFTMAIFQVYFGIDPNLIGIVKTRLTVGSAVLLIGLIPAFALWSKVSTLLPANFVGGTAKTLVRSLTNTVPHRLELPSPQSFSSFEFFDAITGEPKVRYSRTSEGAYEIFDNYGEFDPATGQALLPVTPNVVAQIERQVQEEWRRQHPSSAPTPQSHPPVEAPHVTTSPTVELREAQDSLTMPKDSTSPAETVLDTIAFCVTGNQSSAEGRLRTFTARVLGRRTSVVPIEDCSLANSVENPRYRHGTVRIEFDVSSTENSSQPGFFAAIVECSVEHYRGGSIIAARSVTARAPSGSRRGAEDKALADIYEKLGPILESISINE